MRNSKAETLAQCVRRVSEQLEAADLFYGHGTDNPWDEAVYLVFTVLGVSFDAEEAQMEREVSVKQSRRLDELLTRRIEERIPVAYLVQEAWFAGLPFKVDERVLIPRSPLAELIAQRFEPLLTEAPQRILDLCTGSGCIGIATALAFERAQVDLADISAHALNLARENVERHALQARVHVIESDLFASLKGRYSLILCNPPYVSQSEIDDLPPEYAHEPVLGLYSDEEGLAIPLQILRQAADYLNEDGVLIMEVGYSHEALSERLPDMPFLWLEFDNGGEGIFALTAQQLRDAKAILAL